MVFATFARYADAMLEEREVFFRKAIGWVLRERTGVKRARGTTGEGGNVKVAVQARTAFGDELDVPNQPQGRVFTIGYEGATPTSLVQALVDHGVVRVVDVRYLPNSRRRGFSKSSLAAALAEAGIRYEHVRALGTPPETRRARRDGLSWPEFERRYGEHMAGQGEALETVAAWARTAPVALLCLEADAASCHRSIVARALVEAGAASDVVHLQPHPADRAET